LSSAKFSLIYDLKVNTSTDDAPVEQTPNEGGEASGNEDPKEQEPSLMTLDEWKKQQVCSKTSYSFFR